MRLRLWGLVALFRVEAAVIVAFPALLGAVIAGSSQPVWAYGVGALTQFSSFSLNDLTDRDRDMNDPRRAWRPLIVGVLSPRWAGACAALTGALALVVANYREGLSPVLVLASLMLMVAANLLQKTRAWLAPLCDVAWGVSLGLLVLVSGLTPLTLLGFAFISLWFLMLDISASETKDAEVDQRTGAATTSSLLGCVPAGRGVLPSLQFTLVLIAGYCCLTVLCVLTAPSAHQSFWLIAVGLLPILAISGTWATGEIVTAKKGLAPLALIFLCWLWACSEALESPILWTSFVFTVLLAALAAALSKTAQRRLHG